MKINEIITEGLFDSVKTKVFDTIRRDCAPYLNAIGGLQNALYNYPLYRGSGINYGFTKKEPFKIEQVNMERKSRDTPAPIQKLLDDWFQKNTGIRFRSASVFCTGSTMQAADYGRVNCIIPIGDFHYCWSYNYKDLYIDVGDAAFKMQKEIDPLSAHNQTTKNLAMMVFNNNEQNINTFMQRGDYQFDANLQQSTKSGGEVMISCKQIMVISTRWLRGEDESEFN